MIGTYTHITHRHRHRQTHNPTNVLQEGYRRGGSRAGRSAACHATPRAYVFPHTSLSYKCFVRMQMFSIRRFDDNMQNADAPSIRFACTSMGRCPTCTASNARSMAVSPACPSMNSPIRRRSTICRLDALMENPYRKTCIYRHIYIYIPHTHAYILMNIQTLVPPPSCPYLFFLPTPIRSALRIHSFACFTGSCLQKCMHSIYPDM